MTNESFENQKQAGKQIEKDRKLLPRQPKFWLLFRHRNKQNLLALPNVKHETLNRSDGVIANQPPDDVRVRRKFESNWKGCVGVYRVPRTNVPTRRNHYPPKGRVRPSQMPETV